VQTTGHYLANVVQVGFDCEAFQGLGFELNTWGAENLLWGSDGKDSVKSKLLAEGLSIATTSNDCGDQVNPCSSGWLYQSIGDALNGVPPLSTQYALLLASYSMSPDSVQEATNIYKAMKDIYGDSATKNVPCGGGWNVTHADSLTSSATGLPLEAPLCSSGDAKCYQLWSGGLGAFPRCPETFATKSHEWGTCAKYALSCPITATYYDDTNPRFMDWWTIFYWAWWITWAPFVGFFVAIISRGRTVREVIVGGFVCPTIFAIIWFSVFGGLAIKMERTAELALQVRPDHHHAAVQCSEHYAGGAPITPAAKKLAEAGYYMLTCMPKDDQIYLIMEPYANLQGFLHFVLWLGLVIYFLTSSDSGSMTDDIISASGLSAGFIPPWQKIFWCFTEGLVAIALIRQSGALSSLRALSIVIGLPYTIFLCMMVPACFRVLKKEMKDEDIITSYRFNTQLLDILEIFQPRGGSPCDCGTHMTNLLLGLFAPGVPIWKVYKHLFPADTLGAVLYAVGGNAMYIVWFALQITEVDLEHAYLVAWLMFFGFLCLVIHLRVEMRNKYNVFGSPIDDIFASLILYPFVLSQAVMMADTEGKNAPLYFASADEVIAEMTSLSSAAPVVGAPIKEVEVKPVDVSSTSAA